jgi:hypothetical protein
MRPRLPSAFDASAGLPWKSRLAIAALVLAAHVLVIGWINPAGRRDIPTVATPPLTVVMLLPLPADPAPDPGPPPPRRPAIPSTTSTPRAPAALRAPAPPRADATPALIVEAIPNPDRELTPLFRIDGTIALPDDVETELQRVTADDREFSYQIPGLAESQRLFQRKPAIVYEETRFDANWQPTEDILTSALATAMEKTTVSVDIPMFRNPVTKLRCTVTPLGGGCSFVRPDDNYQVELDDPNTLDAEESRQCQAWWEQIVNATTQQQWRDSRRLYEANCRKPLLRVAAPSD